MVETFRGLPPQDVLPEARSLGDMMEYNFPSISELAAYEPSDFLFAESDPLHAKEHAAGTLLWLEIIRRMPGFANQQFDVEALRWTAVLHDSGRHDGLLEDSEHGERGAITARSVLSGRIADASLELVEKLTKTHVPGSPDDKTIPPWHRIIIKEADKVEQIRIERAHRKLVAEGNMREEDMRIVDSNKFHLGFTYDTLVPLCDAIYEQIDAIKTRTGVNGFRAYLLAAVELGILRPE